MKPRAIYIGFNVRDADPMYKCPICNEIFGGWNIWGQKKNENGTKQYCPWCKTELEGLK